MDQDVVSRKTALQTTLIPAYALTLRLQKALTAGPLIIENSKYARWKRKTKFKKNQRTVIVGFGSVRVLFKSVNGGF